MKIAFFTGRPLGLRGTTGTYRIIDRIREYCEQLVFAPIGSRDIVYRGIGIPLIPVKNMVNEDNIQELFPVVRCFNPDIIYIFNFPGWHNLLSKLKEIIPNSKFILDIKTPLLLEGSRMRDIQIQGCNEQNKLDAILTLSKDSVATWLPECKIEIFEYPLGIESTLFEPISIKDEKNTFRRFVYIGTLHPKRKTEILIKSFIRFSELAVNDVYLDIFGNGPEYDRLYKYIVTKKIENTVRLCGLLPQDKLLTLLPEYDAGIGWVPYEHYNASPSLKTLEYMAAGLPVVASDTEAHKQLITQGFTIDFFENNSESIVKVLNKLVTNGFSAERIKNNLENVKKFDYGYILENYLLPIFKKLINSKDKNEVLKIKESITRNKRSLKKLKIAKDQNYNSRYIHRTSKTLRLCFLCQSLAGGKGGAERVAMETANEMAERGHLVYMAYKNQGRPAYSPKKNVILLPYEKLRIIAKQITAIDPDVFFSFYFNRLLLYYYKIVYGTNIPFGIQECTNPTRLCVNNWDGGKKSHFEASWEREIITSAAACIRLTMPGYALSFPTYMRSNIYAFPNPAFPQVNLAKPDGNSKERKTILNINGFKANKNLITLLRAFERLSSIYPDWDIKVIGKSHKGNEPHKKEILKFIEKKNLQNRVLINGPTDNVYSEYADAQIHVIASLSEGCPTVVLEAMSMGLPSIGYADCQGTNELIRHKENGYLADSEDRVAGMESALRQLMSSPELRCRLGCQALEDSKAFEPQKIYDKWEQLFFKASEYKKDPERLLREQMTIDHERAMHAHRIRKKLMDEFTL